MNSNRIAWVDIAKAICIFSVMINHAQFSQEWLRVDYFFLVGFFFCSGYTFNIDKGLKYRLVRIADSLLIPYLVMAFIMWFPLYRHVLALLSDPTGSILGMLKDIVLGYSMWFIPCLIVTEIIYALAIKFKIAPYVVGGGILLFLLGIITNQKLPWHVDTAMYSIFFFHLGYVCKSINFERLKEKLPMSLTIIIVGIFLWASSQLFILYPFNTSENRFAHETLTLIMNIVAVGSLLLVCIRLNKNRYLDYLGKNSLLLYYIQIPFLSYVYDAMNMVINMKNPYIDNSVVGVVYVFGITILLYPIIRFLNKYPVISGKGKIVQQIVYKNTANT